MRDKQLQLYRLLALPLHSMAKKQEATPILPTLRLPTAFKEVPFAIKTLPVMARLDELFQFAEPFEGDRDTELHSLRIQCQGS
jgi:hypothetical protein